MVRSDMGPVKTIGPVRHWKAALNETSWDGKVFTLQGYRLRQPAE
jgi:hypothetical protein